MVFCFLRFFGFLFEDDTRSTNWKGNAEPCGRCELKICSLWFRSNCRCARFFLRTRHVVISIATGLWNGETSFIFMNFLAFKFLDPNKTQNFWRSLFWWVREFLISWSEKPPQFLTRAAFSREVDFDESCQKTSAVKHWPHAVAQFFICSFWKRGGMNFLRADINSTTMIGRPSPLPTGTHMGVDRPEVT